MGISLRAEERSSFLLPEDLQGPIDCFMDDQKRCFGKHGTLLVLPNGFPITALHLLLVTAEHREGLDEEDIRSALDFALTFPDYVVFHNMRDAGATRPERKPMPRTCPFVWPANPTRSPSSSFSERLNARGALAPKAVHLFNLGAPLSHKKQSVGKSSYPNNCSSSGTAYRRCSRAQRSLLSSPSAFSCWVLFWVFRSPLGKFMAPLRCAG